MLFGRKRFHYKPFAAVFMYIMTNYILYMNVPNGKKIYNILIFVLTFLCPYANMVTHIENTKQSERFK